MDIVSLLIEPAAIVSCIVVAYLVLFRGSKSNLKNGHYSVPDWNFHLKKYWAIFQLWHLKRHSRHTHRTTATMETPQVLRREDSSDSNLVYGTDQLGNSILVKLTRRRHQVAELWIVVRLQDGSVYRLPNHPDTVIENNNSRSWNAAGLRFTVLEPFQRWRVTFNGLLKEGICTDGEHQGGTIKHVRFNLIWRARSAPLHCPDDWSPSLMADALAREPWRDGHYMNMMSKSESGGYDQFGSLSGTVNVENSSAVELSLPGVRQRRWGPHKAAHFHRTASFTGVCCDGTIFVVGANSSTEGLTHSTFGNVRAANGKVLPIDSSDLNIANFGENRNYIPRAFSISFTAGRKSYQVVLHVVEKSKVRLLGGRPWDCESYVVPFEFGINGAQGKGIAQLWYPYVDDYPNNPIPRLRYLFYNNCKPQADEFVVSLEERESQSLDIVGGKGASLALLTSVSNKTYNVPPGFCLTVSALNLQLSDEMLKAAVENLDDVCCKRKDGKLEKVCSQVVDLITTTPINPKIISEINKSLLKIREAVDNCGELRFAVRSSAIGEDSEELSAAGQNDTVLGCHTDEDIFIGVQKCWASLYAYQSVHYRWQHGQAVNCGMGVVIQVMVPADIAGVMFTRHPSTGNPAEIFITANYGLGESVVSAQVEPDTIIVNRDWQGNLSLGQVEIGKKTHSIVMSESGTQQRKLNDQESRECCVQPEDALWLAELGVTLEAMYGGPRDIEWAIAQGEIYLLQARPITSIDRITDHELLHEFDSAVMSAEEVMTFANIGEVLPGASTPLNISFIMKSLDIAINHSLRLKTCPYYMHTVTVTHYKIGLDFVNVMIKDPDPTISFADKVRDIAICGHDAVTPEIHRTAIRRHGQITLRGKIARFHDMAKGLWLNERCVHNAVSFTRGYKLDVSRCQTSQEIYSAISQDMPHMAYMACQHTGTSTASCTYQIIAMAVLTEGSGEFTTDHYHDIGLLLSSCTDVVSAEIPTDLKDISDCILASGKAEEFRSQPVETARHWLEENCKVASTKLVTFLDKHGHRGLKELDLYTETWGLNPDGLVHTLQAALSYTEITGIGTSSKQSSTVKEIIEQLKTPTKNSTRVILKKLVPLCRTAVSRRETTKAALVYMVHQFRLAYRELGKKMVQEGKIPDPEFIFFLTHEEIGTVIATRDPGLVSKAWRRKRLFPEWDKLQFPEMNIGVPRPLNLNSTKGALNGAGDYSIIGQGTPVCPGYVTGRACVVQNFSQVNDIQIGDILITKSTDIGWSPYFPMLGGVVTELGGIISHGAVVAREYGLPCIVGMQGATGLFNTGDIVQLNGVTGTIAKAKL